MKLSKIKHTLYGNLGTVKMRRRHGLFTAEGLKSVADLSSHFEGVALIHTNAEELPAGLPDCFVDVYEVTEAEMRSLSNLTTPSPVMGVFRMPSEEQTGAGAAAIDTERLYVVLDGVRDPGNLGTIIRTCHWFGVKDILASYDTVDCFNPKTIQATMGSLGAVRVRYCDIRELITSHRDMEVYGTLLEGDNIFETSLAPRGFLIMGNEGTGISAGVRELITRPLNIPPATADHGESLNVAVATAIALALIVR